MSFETCEIKNINVTWYVTGVMAYISNDFTQAFFVMILFLVVQPVEACKWLNIVFFFNLIEKSSTRFFFQILMLFKILTMF